MTNEGEHINIKVINAGNCLICGREIKIVTNKENKKYPNIFFCSKCEKLRANKDKPQIERSTEE